MGLFGNTTDASIQDEVEHATSDKLVEEDWQLIMNICDKAGKSSDDSKAWLRTIIKRLYNTDPHIGLKAVTKTMENIQFGNTVMPKSTVCQIGSMNLGAITITCLCLSDTLKEILKLLDACVKNSGRSFHMEVASREFENDFYKLMSKGHPEVARKLRESLKRWSDNEFKSDGQLSLIPSLYHKLRGTYDFSSSETPVKKPIPKSTDPNVVESQEEEDQILKAIELSLKETSGKTASPRNTATSSLYPSVNNISAFSAAATTSPTPAKEYRKVRALYDFEAAEDNELTFSSGEIIMVLDDSDQNWWKGSNQRGEGLFPANFVTANLSVEPEKFLFEKAKKSVQFKEEVKVVEKEPEEIEINEGKVDRLLHLLHEADPTNLETDTDELLSLEREVNAMGPLIDSELERVDRKHAQLTQLSADLVEALGLYHTLMREPQFPTMSKGGYEPTYGYAPPTSSMYNSGLPPGMQHLPQPSMSYPLPGPPGLPSGVQERLPYHPQMPPYPMGGMPPPGLQQSMSSSQSGMVGMSQNQQGGMPSNQQGNMPPQGMHNMSQQGMPPRQQGGMPQGGMPPNFQPMMDDRRLEMMNQYQQGMPTYGVPNMPQPTFPNSGPLAQNSLQNGPAQPPHYVSSSTHIMH